MTSTALPLLQYLANTPIVVCLASTAVSSRLDLSRVLISVYVVKLIKFRKQKVFMLWMPRLPYNCLIFIKMQKFKNDFLRPLHLHFEKTLEEHTSRTRDSIDKYELANSRKSL
nr:unnamed protein product [Callosobruchus analis]